MAVVGLQRSALHGMVRLHRRCALSSISIVRASMCTAVAPEAEARSLSVRERLRATKLDRGVLELIDDQELGRPRKGRRRKRRGDDVDEPPRASPLNTFSRLNFVGTAHSVKALPQPALAEIAFAGRSNVGKSSLLNALSGKICGPTGTVGIAPVANRPGVTRSINFYANDLGAQLVDLPGYGYAFAQEEEVARWQAAMRDYLASRGAPLRIMLVIDARQSLKQTDRDFLLWIDREVCARACACYMWNVECACARAFG